MTSSGATARPTAWQRALQLADATPASRNRYVDFLRALSIGAVITGHWLIAAPWVAADGLRLDHMLALQPWTRGLTWLFQVMPIFFMVGGYSNAASWDAAQRSRQGYGAWVAARLQRLLGPVVPLVLAWAGLALAARLAGVHPDYVRVGSQAALVPVWFLAVYVLVVTLVPLTRAAWRGVGVASFWVLAGAAVLVDAAAFAGGVHALRWTNYLFVWLAVHQLGYLWRDERISRPGQALPWAIGGLLLLLGLVTVGGYPVSMVGVPGEEVSNTLPPTLAMLALGALQGGLLLSLQGPARRWLAGRRPWAATILINGMIMSVYLWHLTAMVLVVGALNLAGGTGLRLPPGSAAWWSTRPLWMALLALALVPLLLAFGRFERPAHPPPERFPAWRALGGALLACGGLALLALKGIGDPDLPGFRVAVVSAALLGAALARAIPLRRSPS